VPIKGNVGDQRWKKARRVKYRANATKMRQGGTKGSFVRKPIKSCWGKHKDGAKTGV